MDSLLHLDPALWPFYAQGGANVLFKYSGSQPGLTGKLLRCPKKHAAAQWSVEQNHELRASLLERLLGEQRFPDSNVVYIDADAAAQEHLARWGVLGAAATLVEYAVPSGGCALEWKPKSALAMGGACCHFCAFNKKTGKSPPSSTYCPRDVFSGDRSAVERAIGALLTHDSRYLKVHGAASAPVAGLFSRALAAESKTLERIASLQRHYFVDIARMPRANVLGVDPLEVYRYLQGAAASDVAAQAVASFCTYKTLADISLFFRFAAGGAYLGVQIIDADLKHPSKIKKWLDEYIQYY